MGALEQIVYEHVEEASFLALLRADAEANPQYDFEDLQELDERLESHLDGLRVGKKICWPQVEEQLVFAEPGEVFVAAFVAFELNDQKKLDQTLKVIEENEEALPGLIWAIKWQSWDNVDPHIYHLLDHENDFTSAAVIAGMFMHQKSCLVTLEDVLHHDNKSVRIEAYKALAMHEGDLFQKELEDALKDKDSGCKFWAARTLLLADKTHKKALLILRDFAIAAGDFARLSVELYARAGGPRQVQNLIDQLDKDSQTQLMIHAIGAFGQVKLLERLYPLMDNDEFAQSAGEAFCTITGANLDVDDLERDAPDRDDEEDDPDNEDTDWEGDDDLDWPDSQLTRAWMMQHQQQFSMNGRYLCGKPVSTRDMEILLEEGYQRQRIAAAIELRLMKKHQALFDRAAPTALQLKRFKL